MSYHWIHTLYPWGEDDSDVVAIRELPKNFYGYSLRLMAPVASDGSILQGDYKLDILNQEKLSTVALEKTERGLRYDGLEFEVKKGPLYRYAGKFSHPDFEFNLAEVHLDGEAHDAFWPRVVIGFNAFEEPGGFPGYKEAP